MIEKIEIGGEKQYERLVENKDELYCKIRKCVGLQR